MDGWIQQRSTTIGAPVAYMMHSEEGDIVMWTPTSQDNKMLGMLDGQSMERAGIESSGSTVSRYHNLSVEGRGESQARTRTVRSIHAWRRTDGNIDWGVYMR